MSYRDLSLGDIAARLPRSTALFLKLGLDFCCGGKQTLDEAAAEKGLDINVIEASLEVLAQQPAQADKDWRAAPLGEIIDFIIPRFHDKHRSQLPGLIEMAEKVESVHADKPECPQGLAVIVRKVYEDLVNHMSKEEQILFPLIKAGRGPMAAAPISVMEAEHDEAGNDLEEMKKLTADFTAPAEACNTWRALYSGLNEFAADLMEHVHLENNVLFPRALRGDQP
ncbi:iron-sulfur cluster repair protein YtfE [Necropsobacter massiliensis]|uniref:iron-sulfur cluster repair protein YtfE n=1 Tax=Necropsobacter massiliensis TaxID=1400001 RepID=UPI000595F977|nr:iron-sulfur cluster repair protein YtfE [Necropsobacter massiliensis]